MTKASLVLRSPCLKTRGFPRRTVASCVKCYVLIVLVGVIPNVAKALVIDLLPASKQGELLEEIRVGRASHPHYSSLALR